MSNYRIFFASSPRSFPSLRHPHCRFKMPSTYNRRDVIWPENDVIELLAQLDLLVAWPQESSCLLTEDQRKEADKKVISQLSEKIDGKYAPRQVRNKLLSLYAEGDTTEYYESNFSIVFRRGSAEMRALDDSTREDVKDRFEQLHTWIPRTKRSSSKHLTPSKLTVSPTPPAQRVHKRRRKLSRTPRSQTQSRTATPCNVWYQPH